MTVAEIARKMIGYSNGNIHDINHFMKVYAYAKMIGECERLDAYTQSVLEAAALVHDIACPLCREKYGNTNGKHQEREGALLVKEFLKDSGLSEAFIDRVQYLVAHHHTLSPIDGPDHQILIEADYIVNADENKLEKSNIQNMAQRIFKTETGAFLLKAIYQYQ